ncbi:hypothetical protein [Jatrophihabitans endophyticus]|uniref:hypothetical protein n=1 Tax=Jatrophihabitans endophyticus TaxID=1206085 RepID=UPI001A0E931E|nr:hypothetical protein [Jatrophihabitans endophyticus]MBE7188319.1 hypothetical protein [Jatrophihabitans endophyticus]
MSTEQQEARTTADTPAGDDVFRPRLVTSLVVAAVVGTGVAIAADRTALALLVGVAVLQALVAVGWVIGTGMPGRKGGLLLAAMAAAGSDVTTSVWPHSRLGALVAVIGLALPVMFLHQLSRGAARTRIVASLSAVAVVVVAVISPAALLQLRHESVDPAQGGRVVAAVVAATAGALVIGYLVDLVVPVPRFDPDVPRGLLAVVASAVVGAGVASVILRNQPGYAEGRAVFVGAAVGAVAGLLAIATTFVLFTTPEPDGRARQLSRPLLAALVPMCLLAPAAFLLCLAIRT